MKKNLEIFETIDEARANRVSPEKFEQTWGYSLEHHVEHMMDFINELEGNGSPAEKQKFNHAADEAQQPTVDHEVDSAENSAKITYVLFISSKKRKEETDCEKVWLNLVRILGAAFAEFELTYWMNNEYEQTIDLDRTYVELAKALKTCQKEMDSKGLMLILNVNAIDQKCDRERIRSEVDRLLAKECNQLKVEEIYHGDIPVLEITFKARVRKKPKERVN